MSEFQPDCLSGIRLDDVKEKSSISGCCSSLFLQGNKGALAQGGKCIEKRDIGFDVCNAAVVCGSMRENGGRKGFGSGRQQRDGQDGNDSDTGGPGRKHRYNDRAG